MRAWGTGLVVGALAIAGAVALFTVDRGSRSERSRVAPGPERRQSPPWGFTAGWSDYCYQRLPAPRGYAAAVVPPGRPCRPGSTRFTTEQQVGLTARAGASIDRLAVSWGAVERTAPVKRGGSIVHTFNWATVVRVYRAMLAAGIRPVVLAYDAPTWARRPDWERPGTCRAAHGELCAYPPSRRHLSDWRAFIEALTRRLPQMVALEVWNEPNLPRFFAPAPSPALYSRLLGAAHRAARAATATAPIVTGGLAAGTSETGSGIPAPRFLSSVYRLAGRGSFEGIGAHPYPSAPPWTERMTANLDLLRRVRDRFHDRATPLWITEVGVGGTSGPRLRGSVGLARQGPVLVRMYRSTQNSDVRAFLAYALREMKTEGPRFEPYGVVRADLQPKPAYCYLSSHLGEGVHAACGRMAP
jgi:polysaccharide biosynthesis protein PslG